MSFAMFDGFNTASKTCEVAKLSTGVAGENMGHLLYEKPMELRDAVLMAQNMNQLFAHPSHWSSKSPPRICFAIFSGGVRALSVVHQPPSAPNFPSDIEFYSGRYHLVLAFL